MGNNERDCRKYENCEFVVEGLLVQDEGVRKSLLKCLFFLYGDDCASWLSRSFGRKPSGYTDKHNAYFAFNDALLALWYSIREGRFDAKRRPSACRAFIYFVSKRFFFRHQSNRQNNVTEISEAENSSLYPIPDFVFPLEEDERVRKIHELIRSMKDKCSEVLLLRNVEGLKIIEIAMKLGVDKKQVIRRLFDCRDKLRKILPVKFNENY
jgi:RNA polymerase sigma factor (sigma-70 family)